jgi:Fe-S-cluster containining protein
MEMPVIEFTRQYCRTVDLGIANRLSLIETQGNDCVFWSGGCTVYEYRPLQCRTYPFWPAIVGSQADWDRESLECPGMNQGEGYSARSIKAFLRQRMLEILISPKR